MKHQVYLKVGPLLYTIHADIPFEKTDQYKEYFFDTLDEIETPELYTSLVCDVELVDKFSTLCGDLVYQNPERMVFSANGKEQRLFGQNGQVYCITYEIDGNHLRLELSRDYFSEVIRLDLIFLEMLAFEKYLLLRNAMVLHSSYVVWNGEGIVFTAPSGTGKSTQAALWKEYAGAEIINGDRSILMYDQERKRWMIHGLPFCGSSNINKDVSAPLKAVIFLEQAPENHTQYYDTQTASFKLFTEISVNKWDQGTVVRVLELTDCLAKSIPMIHYSCNKEPEAVDFLKGFLLI